jgi:2-polyprenyl-3-methyl-5-hydroxy-6-metoxy-1,4-benzoquinol methylase
MNKKQGEFLKENIYGHAKRLSWILSHLHQSDLVVEFGCGTGYMISLQLTKRGYLVYGLDMDEKSISLGRELLNQEGFDPNRLKVMNLIELNLRPDIIIASEVLEHIPSEDLVKLFSTIRNKLKSDGFLLITVPNCYGWFELESSIWYKTGFGQLLAQSKVAAGINMLKSVILGRKVEYPHPATLSDSHHIQQFSYNSIQKLLKDNGFEVLEIRGSVLFSGPFSNLLFTGIERLMKINCMLGQWFPKVASGFYIRCRPALKELTK